MRPRSETTVWLVPSGVAAIVLAAALAARPNLDGHEVLAAQTAREMLANGDWVHPTFSGEPRLLKPPFAYWVTAAAYAAFGSSNEITARLPSAVAAVAAVVLIAVWSSRLFGRRIGLTAGFVHATTFATLQYGRMSLVDSWVSLLSIAAVAVASWDRPCIPGARPTRLQSWFMPFLFWSLIGLNVLAKGPVGPAIVLPAVFFYRLLRGRSAPDFALVRHPAFAFGLAALTIVAAGWAGTIAARNPHVLDVWREQSLSRFLVHWGPQTRPWYYYFYTCGWLLLPWTPLAAVGLSLSCRRLQRRGWKSNAELFLLLAWFATAFALCSASAGKRPHYILAGLPPLSVVSAFAAVWLLRRRPAVRWMWNPRPALALVGANFVVFGLLMPLLQHRREESAMIARHRAQLQAAEVVAQYGSRDHWAIFPVGRPMAWPRSIEELDRCTAGRDSVLLMPRRRLAEVKDAIEVQELDPEPKGRTDPDALVAARRLRSDSIAERPKSLTR